MKTKKIPFDLDKAKKIQAGELKGKIVTSNGYAVRIICFDKRTSTNYPILGLVDYPNQSEMCKAFNVHGLCYDQPIEYVLQIELPEEAQEEQHPIEESELYQAGYKVGFEAGRCVAFDFDEKKGCAINIKKEAPKYDDVEELPICDGSIVSMHKKHEFKPFDKVLVRDNDTEQWRTNFFSHMLGERYVCVGYTWMQCIAYDGHEHLVGTTNKPKGE